MQRLLPAQAVAVFQTRHSSYGILIQKNSLQFRAKPIYVLGTDLSHGGSSYLLKDGRICPLVLREDVQEYFGGDGFDNQRESYTKIGKALRNGN